MFPESAVVDEAARLAALRALALLDTSPEPVFDAITAAAAAACGVPISLVSLVDAERQWFKSQLGLPGVDQTPRDVAFCDHAIRSDALFEVGDAADDPRFAANPLVTGDPGIRFYAGAPIVLPGGERIGTVCVIDRVPRQLDGTQRAALANLARIASACVADRARHVAATAAVEASERRYRGLYESTPALMQSVDHQGRLVHVSDLWLQVFGYTRDEVIGGPVASFYTPDSQRHAREVALPAFLRTGRSDEVELDMVCKGGRVLHVLLSAVMERDDLGRQLRSLSVLQDVTEKRRLAAELEGALARLTAVVDNVPALLCHCDAQGIVRFVNREFQAAAGLPIDRIIGRPLREVQETVDPTGFLRLEPRLAEVMRGRRQEFELGLLTSAGLRQFRTTLVPDGARVPDRALVPDGALVPEAALADRAHGFYWMAYDVTGRKALELRLSDSEQRYRSLFDYLNSGFALHEIVVDHDGRPVDYRYLAMNAAFTALSGLDPLTSIGRCVTELFPGIQADPADWIGVYGRVAQSGEPVHFEQHSSVLDRWFEVVAYRPAPGQFAVIAQDITQRKSATEQLALSEQRLRLLIDAVQDHAMILLDVQGHIETWNAGAERMNGHAADEIIGQHYRCFFDEAEIARGDPESQLAAAEAYGRFTNEGWRVRRDGARFWVAVTLTAVRDPSGRLQGFVKVTRDLTERQRRQELLLRVAELSPSAMLLFDGTGHIVFVNAQTEAMFGYGRDELIGKFHESLLPERRRASDGAVLHDFLKRGDARMVGTGQVAKGRRKDGSEFDAEVGLSAFDTEDGRVALAAVIDVTERRRQQQRLQEALMEKETLLKEVYHRVKNNLQVVQSLLNLQHRGMAEGPARAALAESVQRVRAMALVHEKLYQSGNLAAVSLAEYTRDLLRQIDDAAGASQRGIAFVADIAPLDIGLDSAIPFGLLVAELVGNSLKHGFQGRADGRVSVTLAPEPGGVRLTVADNGAGLPPGFDPADRASMGLQLAIGLVRQLGGELHAESVGDARFHALLTRL